MQMRRDFAVVEALEMFRNPVRARSNSKRQLPEGMLSLIKIAAGDEATVSQWAQSCRETPDVIRQAAVFYLQQTIAQSGSDKFRMLGLSAQASKDDVRAHKRWLLKWLHPDLNPSKWQTALFYRISAVAETIVQTEGDIRVNIPALGVASQGEQKAHRHSGHRRHRHQATSRVHRFSWKALFKRLLGRRVMAVAIVFGAILISGLLNDSVRDRMHLLAYGY
jgi:inorganic triphosphatase YgiF